MRKQVQTQSEHQTICSFGNFSFREFVRSNRRLIHFWMSNFVFAPWVDESLLRTESPIYGAIWRKCNVLRNLNTEISFLADLYLFFNVFRLFCLPLSSPPRLTVQLQTFSGERKVIHLNSQTAFVSLWMTKCIYRLLQLFGGPAILPICLPRCFALSSRRITKLFFIYLFFCRKTFFLLFFSNLASSPLHAQGVSSFCSSAFQSVFSDLLGRKTFTYKLETCANNTSVPVWAAWKKKRNIVVFRHSTNPTYLFTACISINVAARA